MSPEQCRSPLPSLYYVTCQRCGEKVLLAFNETAQCFVGYCEHCSVALELTDIRFTAGTGGTT